MKKGVLALLAALCMTALIAGGCANKEVVKSEEGLVPKTDVAKAAPAKAETKSDTTVKPVESAEKIEPATATKQAAKASASANGFETIYFDFDKSDLRQDARDVLNKNAEILKSKSGSKIQIEGHCDERGSSEYNLALGERRAKSSMQYLITLGVNADRLSIISYGKEKPAVQGSDEAAWAKNRRAEFVIAK